MKTVKLDGIFLVPVNEEGYLRCPIKKRKVEYLEECDEYCEYWEWQRELDLEEAQKLFGDDFTEECNFVECNPE